MQQQGNLWYLSLCRFQIAGGARSQSRDICRLSICRFAFRSICPLTRQTSAFTSRRLVISTLWDDKSRRNNRSTNNEPTDKLLIIIKERPWRQWRVCRNLKMRARAKLQRIQISKTRNVHQLYYDKIVVIENNNDDGSDDDYNDGDDDQHYKASSSNQRIWTQSFELKTIPSWKYFRCKQPARPKSLLGNIWNILILVIFQWWSWRWHWWSWWWRRWSWWSW